MWEAADGFLQRMGQDVLPFHPTVATLSYGIIDGGGGALDQGAATRYRTALSGIVRQLHEKGVRLVVVGSPGCVDSETYHSDPKQAEVFNTTLSALRDIGRDLAQGQKAVFADVFDIMMDTMEKAKAKYGRPYMFVGWDGQSPTQNGSLVMAYAFLKALGCDGDLGTITLDLATNQATGTSGHKILSCANGRIEVESTRYPFCFFGDPFRSDSTSGIVEFFAFNKDLNRLMLVGQNAQPAVRYRVTWGGAYKVFKGSDLAKGVNLAAEFQSNPFCGQFQAVERQIHVQQDYESNAKTLLHSLPSYRDALPDEVESIDRMQDKLLARDATFAKASSAAVLPVTHTIVVEAVGQ
jgi:hypothetical protein